MLLAVALVAVGSGPLAVRAEDKSSDWIELFNGRDLDGWQVVGEPGRLLAGDRRRAHAGRGGWLAIDHPRVRRLRAGVGVRAARRGQQRRLHPPPAWRPHLALGMEIQLLDEFADYQNLKPCETTAPSTTSKDPGLALKQPGEWQKIAIRAVGRKLTIKLNDQPVLDADLRRLPRARRGASRAQTHDRLHRPARSTVAARCTSAIFACAKSPPFLPRNSLGMSQFLTAELVCSTPATGRYNQFAFFGRFRALGDHARLDHGLPVDDPRDPAARSSCTSIARSSRGCPTSAAIATPMATWSTAPSGCRWRSQKLGVETWRSRGARSAGTTTSISKLLRHSLVRRRAAHAQPAAAPQRPDLHRQPCRRQSRDRRRRAVADCSRSFATGPLSST